MPPINGKGQSAPIMTMINDVLISIEDQINDLFFIFHMATCSMSALITINHCQTDPKAKCFRKINSWYEKRQ